MPALSYRPEVDGLRAVAVLAVVFFHFGWFPNGYLGVDVFFVISGYLITRILYRAKMDDTFSLKEFYVRRARRILPLVLFFCLFSLAIGALVMLPDDFENLAQSVFATVCFGNNLLLLLTTGNYWDVINDFKPLMHTWSLGVEEQFYLLYPFLFLVLRPGRVRLFAGILGALALTSLALNYLPGFSSAERFYLLPFRFYELAAGGGGAILLGQKQLSSAWLTGGFIGLVAVMFLPFTEGLGGVLRPLTVALSAMFLAGVCSGRLAKLLLTNSLVVGLGKISFSVYLWHQVLLAFARYFLFAEMTSLVLTGILALTILLSVLTFWGVETPFRRYQPKKNLVFMVAVLAISGAVAITSLWLYARAGVIRDVPELEIKMADAYRGMHDDYLVAIDATKASFAENDKLKVLVVGDSYASDWINVLKQSTLADRIDIAHFGKLDPTEEDVALEADVIYYARKSTLSSSKLGVERITAECSASVLKKIRIVGTKNFGSSMGIYYNSQTKNYCDQTTTVPPDYALENAYLKEAWGDRYLDVISLLSDDAGKLRVFDDECHLISHDGRHLTRAGAIFLAERAAEEIQIKN